MLTFVLLDANSGTPCLQLAEKWVWNCVILKHIFYCQCPSVSLSAVCLMIPNEENLSDSWFCKNLHLFNFNPEVHISQCTQNTTKSHPLHSPPPTCQRRKDIETGTKNNWDDDPMLLCMPKLKHSDLATLHHKYLSSKPTDLTKRELRWCYTSKESYCRLNCFVQNRSQMS